MASTKSLIEEADSHTRMVINSFKKGKFDNKFLLSIATIALEKYMVAFLIEKDGMPEGHTLSYLIQEVGKYSKVALTDISIIQELDDKIQLCSLESVAPYIPSEEEMENIIAVLKRIQMTVIEN